MKPKIVLLVLVFIQVATNGWAGDFTVDNVIRAIKEDIRLAQGNDTGKPKLKIDRVELELGLTSELSGEAGIKLMVAGGLGVNVGASGSKGTSQTIKLVLTPVGDLLIGTAEDHGLTAAILSVKNALRNAYNEPPKFNLNDFVFETEFAIKKSAGGGISFWIVDLAGLKQEQISTHRVKIHLSLAG